MVLAEVSGVIIVHFANRAIDLSDQEMMRGNDEEAAEDHERKIQAHIV